jgi:hypothetical protein
LEISHREEIDRRHSENAELHALQMSAQEEMRTELLLSSAAEISRMRSDADKERLDEIARLMSELEVSHREEMDRLHSETSAEIARVRSNADMERLDEIKEEQATALCETDATLGRTVDERYILFCGLSELQAEHDSILSYSHEAERDRNKAISSLKASMMQKGDEAFDLNKNSISVISQLGSLDDEGAKIKSESDEFANMLKSSSQELLPMREQTSAYSAYVSKLETSVEAISRERDESSVNLLQLLFDKDVQLSSMSSRIQELEEQLQATNDDCLNMTEKVNHFQQLAGKLAVSVLKLKVKCKPSKDRNQLISQVVTQNKKIAMLERCLDGVKADRQALAATHFHQHKKLTATTADLRKKMLDELLRKKIDHLQSENHSLRMEGAAAKLKLEQNNDALMDAQAVKSSVENRLEAVMQDRSHLTDEVNSMRNTITILEAGKESFLHRLHDYQGKATLLSNKVTLMENQAVSNEDKILKIESQLGLKKSEAEASNKRIDSHEATITELRNQIVSSNRQIASMDGMQSSLKTKMVRVLGERDGLALQLDKHVTELKQLQDERNKLVAMVAGISTVHNQPGHGLNPHAILNKDSVMASHGVQLEVTPQAEMISISKIGQTTIAPPKCEKKLLKEEVNHLRARLEQALQELAVVKKDCKNISRVASKARALLEKTKSEKDQLAVYLDVAQQTLKRIQGNSSQSPDEREEQSKEEINKPTTDPSERDESTHSTTTSAGIDRTDTRNDIPPNDNTAQGCICSKNDNGPKVTSYERFTIAKGQSMLNLLKEIKKSGRKQKMKYRRDEKIVYMNCKLI